MNCENTGTLTKLYGVLKIFLTVVVEILKRNVALETVQNRAARALGNLAMDPEGSALIHSAGSCRSITFSLQLECSLMGKYISVTSALNNIEKCYIYIWFD